MRVLVSTTANDGHFGPLFPFVRALLRAGHEVRVAAPQSYGGALGRAGLTHEAFADVPPAVIGPVMGRLPTLTPMEADTVVLQEVFGRLDAQAGLPGVVETIERWRPDLVLRETAELASLAAAEEFGLPHVQVCIGMHEVLTRFAETLRGPLEELDQLAGLSSGQLSTALDAEPVLSLVPELLDHPDGKAGDGRFRRFHEPTVASAAPRPTEWGDAERPLVYVTFGSVAGALPPFAGIFRQALDTLADLDASIVMTVGHTRDPRDLGPLPDNAFVTQWIAQSEVLAHASALLGHGGFGTTLGALAAGVPQAIAPLFSFDQVVNGEHVAAVGAGRTGDLGPDSVTRMASAIPDLLTDLSYAQNAREVRAALATLPSPDDAVPDLAALVG